MEIQNEEEKRKYEIQRDIRKKKESLPMRQAFISFRRRVRRFADR